MAGSCSNWWMNEVLSFTYTEYKSLFDMFEDLENTSDELLRLSTDAMGF